MNRCPSQLSRVQPLVSLSLPLTVCFLLFVLLLSSPCNLSKFSTAVSRRRRCPSSSSVCVCLVIIRRKGDPVSAGTSTSTCFPALSFLPDLHNNSRAFSYLLFTLSLPPVSSLAPLCYTHLSGLIWPNWTKSWSETL